MLTSLLARLHRATLRLRIDDLDAERSRPAYVDDIFASLKWLGITWNEGPGDEREQERVHSQVHRVGRYMEFVELLKEQGDLYACTCSRSTLKEMVRKGLRRCECPQRGVRFEDHDACWRLHLPADAIVRMHALHGPSRELLPAELLTDPVLRQRAREGGRPAYQIASLIDDLDHGTTMIIRGEDLLPSTACQLYLAERLGLHAFREVHFVHHPLLLDAEGRKLSKSEGAGSLRSMRKAGASPEPLLRSAEEMLAMLVAHGHSNP